MVIHKTSSKIEQDEAEIDYSVAEMESAQGILDQPKKKKPKKKDGKSLVDTIKRYPMSRKRKHLLFMNPGDFPVQTAILAITRGNPLPAWARPFRDRISVNQGVLYWTTTGNAAVRLPFLMKDEKRHAVKRLYFDPREPSTIMPITLQLYSEFANVSKSNVTRILKSLETYQLNFGRRRPPDLKNRFFMYNPGMLAMDMFFPSKHHGWEKTNVLCCMDTWSRYCGVYAIDTKRMADVLKAMNDFLKKFAAMGHIPRRILSDVRTWPPPSTPSRSIDRRVMATNRWSYTPQLAPRF